MQRIFFIFFRTCDGNQLGAFQLNHTPCPGDKCWRYCNQLDRNHRTRKKFEISIRLINCISRVTMQNVIAKSQNNNVLKIFKILKGSKFTADAIGLPTHATTKQKIAKALGSILSIVMKINTQHVINKLWFSQFNFQQKDFSDSSCFRMYVFIMKNKVFKREFDFKPKQVNGEPGHNGQHVQLHVEEVSKSEHVPVLFQMPVAGSVWNFKLAISKLVQLKAMV